MLLHFKELCDLENIVHFRCKTTSLQKIQQRVPIFGCVSEPSTVSKLIFSAFPEAQIMNSCSGHK